jgi:DNA-binding MarR family transcriptional regulator
LSEWLAEEAIEAHEAFSRAMQTSAMPVWLQLDLTMAQLKLLFALDYAGTVKMGHLTEMLGVGLPAVSQIMDRVVQQGLAERREDTDDRRRTLVGLSVSGVQLIHMLRQGGRERLRGWLSQLDEGDLEALVRGLRALAVAASGSTLSPIAG